LRFFLSTNAIVLEDNIPKLYCNFVELGFSVCARTKYMIRTPSAKIRNPVLHVFRALLVNKINVNVLWKKVRKLQIEK